MLILKQAKERASEKLDKIMTDGLWAYEKAFKKVFYSRDKINKVELIRKVGIRTRETNNTVFQAVNSAQ